MSASMQPTTHFRTCHLCEAMCGIEITLAGGQIQSIRGDHKDPLSRGHICPKAVALQDLHSDPDRLKHPLRRTSKGWQKMPWDEAFDEVATRIKEIQRTHGRNAIGAYLGNPNVHNYGTLLFGPPLLKALRTQNRFSATSLDQLPHHMAAAQMFGHQLLLPVPDLERTELFVIMGGNPLASNGSMMGSPDIKKRLKEIQARGQVVVIDPRRTETAAVADQHIFIRPGTDALLLLAVLHVIHQEGLAKPGRLAPHIDGLDLFWSHVTGITPAMVAPLTGIEADQITALARRFAAAKHAVWYGRMGVSTQAFGALCQWLIHGINLVTGRIDQPGGFMFARPAVDIIAQKLAGRGKMGRWHSRVRGLPEFGGELPAAVMAEEILTPGKDQIRAMITVAGNPVLSSPNGRQLEKALAQLDFMVSIDIYRNETTRHADIILPPTFGLEHEHYDVVFLLLGVRNFAKFSPALLPPDKDTRHDWEILLELQTRLEAKGGWQSIKSHARRAALRRLGPTGLLDLGLRFGPHGAGLQWWRKGLSLKALQDQPHGVDLGAHTPCFPERLMTPSKRIQAAPAMYLEDLPRLRAHFGLRIDAKAPSTVTHVSDVAALEKTENTDHLAQSSAASDRGDASAASAASDEAGRAATSAPETSRRFLLIGRRQLRSNNSWLHNAPRLTRGKARCTLLMHPDDGALCQLSDEQSVTLYTRVGQISAPVEFSTEMMPGVVSLPHGWGHHREGIALENATQHPGVSLNDITDELAIDQLSGNAAFNGLPVWIEAS